MSETNLRAAPGGYDFLPGGSPYSCGVIAQADHEIVHVTLAQPLPYRRGFAAVESFLEARRRPAAALCALELRSPAPFSFDGFAAFNAVYGEEVTRLGLWVDGENPLARTNVAPAHDPPGEVLMSAFSFTIPSSTGARTFVVAGAGELRSDALAAAAVVRPGQTSPEAMVEKARNVTETIGARMAGLGAGWGDVTVINIYSAHAVEAPVRSVVLTAAGSAAAAGVRWLPSHPPVADLAFEMDVRGVRRELVVDLADA